MNRILRALAAAALVLTAASAAAQERHHFDLERLWLDPSARGSLVLGDGEVLDAGQYRAGAAVHFEYRPLVFTADGDMRGRGLFADRTAGGDIINQRVTLHLLGAIGIGHGFELNLGIPFIPYQHGSQMSAFSQADEQAIGAPVFGIRDAFFSQGAGAPVNAALSLMVSPQWDAAIATWAANDGWVLAPNLEVGRILGGYLVAANLGGRIRTTDVKLTDGEKLGSEVTAGAVFATTGGPLRFEVSARGAFNFNGVSQSAELLGGVRYDLGPVELFALAGPGFMEAPGTPTWRGLVGLAVKSEKKAPPPAAEPPPPPPPPAAAPPPPPPPPPDPCAPGQTHTPEQCPDLDDDGDGVPNGQDRCPTEKGLPELQGCPAVDTDGDGVPDHLDRCPNEPGVPDNQGCPPKKAAIKAGKIDIKERVFFDTGKATIQKRSHELLDDVAKLIVANPGVGVVVVEGHTDSLGPAAFNKKLSQARAEAVKTYLVEKGVPAERLEAVGHGSEKPTAPNDTPQGRDANRRVEFTVQGVPAAQ